ncbi:hypothetical protein [Ruminococcus sp.]|uniref:hypothetical protein n=1 Tax=Ruminococcus sp. TaxID=41978 RepID=UPI0038635741
MKKNDLSIFIRSYWDYYLELEEQFKRTSRYVAFDSNNKNTYSVEYLKLFQAVCSEIDVVAKEISTKLDSSFKVDRNTNIKKWGYILQNHLPSILTQEVVFNHKEIISPWKHWQYVQYRDKTGSLRYKLKEKTQTPKWWRAYNDVKHARTQLTEDGSINYSKANLGNLISSFAALFILETEYMTSLSEQQQPVDGIDGSLLFQYYYEVFDDLIY